MRMFNADGSEGAMCGNGIRCLGKYVYERGLIKKHIICVETKSGIRTLYLDIEDEMFSIINTGNYSAEKYRKKYRKNHKKYINYIINNIKIKKRKNASRNIPVQRKIWCRSDGEIPVVFCIKVVKA